MHRTPDHRFARAALLLFALLIQTTVFAQLAAGDYRFDPAFNAGAPYLDRFANNANNDYRGRFIVNVPDIYSTPPGDTISVGLVPKFGEGNSPSGKANIGLVRYSRTGQRRVWTDPEQGGFSGGQYVITPNENTASPTGIYDLIGVTPVYKGGFFVITNEYYAVPDLRVVIVRRFSTTGRVLDTKTIMEDPDRQDEKKENFYAFDVTLQDDGGAVSLVVLGRRYTSDGGPITGCETGNNPEGCNMLGIVPLDANGNMIAGSASVFGMGTGDADFYRFHASAIASGARGALSPYLYVAGIIRNGNDQRIRVYQLNSAGSPLGSTTLSLRGVAGRDEYNPRLLADPNGAAGSHTLFVAGETEQQCQRGAAVVKLSASLQQLNSFDGDGKLLFGGNDEPLESQGCAYGQFASPLAMAIDDDGRLAVVGQRGTLYNQNDILPAGMLAVIDSFNGTLLDIGGYAAMSGGNPIGFDAFYGVVPSGGGAFTVAGDQRDDTSGNHLMFITARLVGVTLFEDGFE